jgi:GNAT superfamily N-acetyltransferase
MQPMPEALKLDYRIAEPDDLESLYALYEMFFDESALPKLGLEIDPERGKRWLVRAIETSHPTQLIAVERDNDTFVVGVLGFDFDHTATTKPFAYLDKFYVHRNWRRSKVGATLLMVATDLAKSEGAVAFRAGLSGGIPGGDSLFRAAGFTETPHSVLFEMRL